MQVLPETVLQFGGGNFLRAFADLFIHEANRTGQGVGRVVVVQSTQSNRAELINAQKGRYHVLIRGLLDGEEVDRVQEVRSIGRALVAQSEWDAVLDIGRSPDLRMVISNTTEAGYALDPEDRPGCGAPRSFPAKLLRVLKARFDAGLPGVTILPCELVEENADLLFELVLKQARSWGMGDGFVEWLRTDVFWLNTQVDRIVSGRPESHPLLSEDALLTLADPFALWVIEEKEGADSLFEHPDIRRTPDVKPFLMRKVRILNAAHTALVCRALPRGIETVGEAVTDPEIGPWLRDLLFEEIVPTLKGRVEEPEAFAEGALERFASPFLKHRLSDIALYHDTKVKLRLMPTCEVFERMFGRKPPLLSHLLKDYLEATP